MAESRFSLNAADNTNGGLLMILTSVIKANVIIIGLEVHLFTDVKTMTACQALCQPVP